LFGLAYGFPSGVSCGDDVNIVADVVFIRGVLSFRWIAYGSIIFGEIESCDLWSRSSQAISLFRPAGRMAESAVYRILNLCHDFVYGCCLRYGLVFGFKKTGKIKWIPFNSQRDSFVFHP